MEPQESEKQHLLGEKNKDGKFKDSVCPDMAKLRKICSKRRIIIVVAIITCSIAAIGGTVAFGVKFALYKSDNSECQKINHGPIKGAHCRSGSYSILDTITSQDSMCFAEPQLLLSLEDRDSSVEVYQTLCQNIETQPFRVNYHFTDLPSAEGPRSLFDENFSPQNYFMNGNMQVDIINATTMFPSRDIQLCLFSDHYEYNSFLRAGIKWKNCTKSATCITVTAAKSGETDNTVLFNISKPMFTFLGLATTDPVQIDLINITAIGQDISGLRENSTKVCQLNRESTTCNLSLLNDLDLKSQSICIVAYEEEKADGTYDYHNISITIPIQVKHGNPYKMRLAIYGPVFLGIILILMVTLLGDIIRKRCQCSDQNPSTPVMRDAATQPSQLLVPPINSSGAIQKHHIPGKDTIYTISEGAALHQPTLD